MIARPLKKSVKNEIYRKTIHLTSLWIPLLIYSAHPLYSAAVLLTLTIADFFIEYLYHQDKLCVSRLIKRKFIRIMRYSEIKPQEFHPSGALYLLISSFCATVLFTPAVASIAVCILIVADSAAAVTGKLLGTIKLAENKTVEGSLTFFLTTLFILWISVFFHLIAATDLISLAAIIALAELAAPLLKLDDNFLIPLVAGGMLSSI